MFVGNYYYLFGKSILPRETQGRIVEGEKTASKAFKNGREDPGMLLLTNQFHDLLD